MRILNIIFEYYRREEYHQSEDYHQHQSLLSISLILNYLCDENLLNSRYKLE